MPESLNFGVDPKLAALLGRSYNSTEKAIKELVDNAWDADASEVLITLPDQMSSDPIVVADDGDGMTVSALAIMESALLLLIRSSALKGPAPVRF